MSEDVKGLLINVPRISRLNKAKVIGQSEGEFCTGIEGDIRFRAPEVMSGKGYNHKADVWSFGIILFFIFTGILPFDNNYSGVIKTREQENISDFDDNIEYKIKQAEPNYDLIKDQGFSKECCDLVSKLLNKDPELRLTMKAANIHPWFTKNIDFVNNSDLDQYDIEPILEQPKFKSLKKKKQSMPLRK